MSNILLVNSLTNIEGAQAQVVANTKSQMEVKVSRPTVLFRIAQKLPWFQAAPHHLPSLDYT
jgi:hypothetical protein